MPKIAVVLSGCGVYDGTEVHEAAAALGWYQLLSQQLSIYAFLPAALSRAGAEVEMFAPDGDQAHVVDHTKGAEMEQTRR